MTEGDKAAPFYLAIVGPTASGKSGLALDIAKKMSGAIINCDSIQLYRGFNIGAAKPTLAERSQVEHFLYDIFDWNEDCDAIRYAELSRKAILEISQKGKLPILVGGTGLYLRALSGQQFHKLPSDPQIKSALQKNSTKELWTQLCEVDPLRSNELHSNDRVRILRALEINLCSGLNVSQHLHAKSQVGEFSPGVTVFLNPERALLHVRIEQRVDQMIKQGLFGEVEALLAAGCPLSAKPMQSIGYRQVADALQNPTMSVEKTRELIIFATRQYAKRQITWFKKSYDLLLDAAAENNWIEMVCSAIARQRGVSNQ